MSSSWLTSATIVVLERVPPPFPAPRDVRVPIVVSSNETTRQWKVGIEKIAGSCPEKKAVPAAVDDTSKWLADPA